MSTFVLRYFKNPLQKTKGTIKNGQSRETGNIEYEDKQNKTHETQKDKNMSNTDPTKSGSTLWYDVIIII